MNYKISHILNINYYLNNMGLHMNYSRHQLKNYKFYRARYIKNNEFQNPNTLPNIDRWEDWFSNYHFLHHRIHNSDKK